MNKKSSVIFRILLYTGVVFVVIPFLILPIWSFATRWPWPYLFPQQWSGRGVLSLFFQNTQLADVMISSVGLSLIVGLLSTIIGLMTARALAFYDWYGKTLLRFGVLLPMLVPATAFTMGVQITCLRMGIADTIIGVVLVHTIVTLPYTVTILTDGVILQGIGLEQQGQVLGASWFQTFLHVTIPLSMPDIVTSMTMAYIISFSQYFLTLMIGGGRVITLSIIMVPYIQGGDRTLAACYSLIFVMISFLVFILLRKSLLAFGRVLS